MKAGPPAAPQQPPAPARRTRAFKRAGVKTLDLYERLKAMAMSYQIGPGQSVNELEIARRFGASRSTVREALSRLAAEHFLSFVPNRGFHGRALEPREVFDLYELRAYVEAAGLELALARAGDADIDALKAFWQGVTDTAHRLPDDALLRLDEEMHVRLARLSGNAELVRMLESLNARIHFIRWVQMRERRQATYDEHHALLEALGRRDAVAAQAILAAHIGRRREEISQAVQAGVGHLTEA